MATIRVSDALLRRLCDINQFPIPKDAEMVFFGIRGALPYNPDNYAFEESRSIVITSVNYTSFRCTLGQWNLKTGKVAIYPGSTVPGIKNIRAAISKKGMGTNQMLPGFYDDVKKGWHQGGSAKFGHSAFRQTRERPVRRSATDAIFTEDDLLTYEIQHDNIHSGFRTSVQDNLNASHGCQIIVGMPDCEVYKASGGFKAFKEAAYAVKGQEYFCYMLLNAKDYERVDMAMKDPFPRRLRYGSAGEAVKALQGALADANMMEDDEFEETSIFDIPTFKAVINYQKKNKLVTDGVVGKGTAAMLGIDLGDSLPASAKPTPPPVIATTTPMTPTTTPTTPTTTPTTTATTTTTPPKPATTTTTPPKPATTGNKPS